MDQAQLIEGVIWILRENVDGWAVEDGTQQVVPTHPASDLNEDKYPRATVDIIASTPTHGDIENKQYVEDATVDVTVYALDSLEMNQLSGQSKQAVVSNHEGTDSDGNAYLPDWAFVGPGITSPTLETGDHENLTRFQRTAEFEFRTITTE